MRSFPGDGSARAVADGGDAAGGDSAGRDLQTRTAPKVPLHRHATTVLEMGESVFFRTARPDPPKEGEARTGGDRWHQTTRM